MAEHNIVIVEILLVKNEKVCLHKLSVSLIRQTPQHEKTAKRKLPQQIATKG
eukprot:gene7983-5543_t